MRAMPYLEKVKDSVSAFNSHAKEYDRWYFEEKNKPIFLSELNAIKKLGIKGLGAEIGVGTGIFASKLNIPLGVDPARSMLNTAKERKIVVLQAVAEFLPFKSNSLDYLAYIFTLCFLSEIEKALIEARRVLRKKGFLILCFIPKDSVWGELYIQKKREEHKIYKYANFYSRKEVFGLLEKTKFKVVDFYGTLYQNPSVKPFYEKPKKKLEDCGFLCQKAIKHNE